MTMSKPIFGMYVGMLVGLIIGLTAAWYFSMDSWLAVFCLVASLVMFFQLMGATIAATVGRPHDDL